MRRADSLHRRQAATPGLSLACAALIGAATIFGGASRENAILLAIVEVSALPLGVIAVRGLIRSPTCRRGAALSLILLALIVAVPLLQAMPLPPAIWSRLPGQSPRLEALGLAGVGASWLPISLTPQATARAALALLPPAAMFLGALQLDTLEARGLGLVWIALAAIGLLLGVGQMASPEGGLFYPYATTNLGSLVGLFANRNHEAAFLLALLAFAAILATPPTGPRAAAPAPVSWLMGLFVVMAVVALGVIRSRAGLILAGPAVVGALWLLWRGARTGPARIALAGVAAAVVLAAAAVALFGLGPILDRFAPATGEEVRLRNWPYVLTAARACLPLGAGLGSFERVFQSAEPLNLVWDHFFNHAHNDYLELWLETGVPGLVIFLLFLIWLGRAIWRAWRGGGNVARAAGQGVLLLMAASAVDYPLRTETNAVLFAFCCGLLERAVPTREVGTTSGQARSTRR